MRLSDYIPNQEPRVAINMKVPQSTLETLDAMAARLGVTRTALVIALVLKEAAVTEEE